MRVIISTRTPLVVYLDKRYLLAFKICMLLVSLPFLYDVFIILSSGLADSGEYVVKRGEGWGYYAYFFKKSAFAFLFVWLGTLGSKEKLNTPED